MAGNIRIYDDEDELDAEEDEREPVDGDPVVNDDEDEEDALYMFSIYTWDGGRGERVGLHRPKQIPSIPLSKSRHY